MIDFTCIESITISEGLVSKITDSSGTLLWQYVKPAVLQVAKQNITSLAGETEYDDYCVLIDIYPKIVGSVITVTYGNVSKTITAKGTNAETVYFGTFNGVSDNLSTPSSGKLTIEGAFDAFGCGSYKAKGTYKSATKYCSCITHVTELGGITYVPSYAFYNCTSLTNIVIPNSVTSIGEYAFDNCSSLTSIVIPDSVTSIGDYAFSSCSQLLLERLPANLVTIGAFTFEDCVNMTVSEIPEGVTSIGEYAFFWDLDEDLPQLSSLLLPSTVQHIESSAFLMKVYDPYGVYETTKRRSIYKNITIRATQPPILGSLVFGDDSKPINKLVVPQNCSEAYKTADGWSTYADKIVEAS